MPSTLTNVLPRKKYVQDLLSDKNDSKSSWTAVNQLTNKPTNPKHQVNIKISAEQLNDHFSAIAEKRVNTNPESNTLDKLREFCHSRNIQGKLDIALMKVADIYNALKHLKQSETRDLDGLNTKILRLAASFITNTLTCVFNLCIMTNTFPNAFKIAKVIPLYKSGDSVNPSNYRSISIVSVLAKPL